MRRVSNNILVAMSAAAVMATALAGCHKKAGSDAAPLEQVSVATPVVDSLVLRKTYPATLAAVSSADVVARVNGTITKMLFEDGQYVTAGQPLYIIESSTYLDDVNSAQGALETATAEHDFAVKQAAALAKALESDAVSKMEVIQADSRVKQTEAAIRQARASLSTARTNLGYCTVRAPISGRISESNLSAGAYVGGGVQPQVLTRVYGDRQLYVMFSVETDRFLEMQHSIKEDALDYNNVPVTFGDTIVGTYQGKLDYTAPDVSESTGTVVLRLLLDNHKGELRSGMYCNVHLPIAVDTAAILIRDASVSTDQLGKFVYLVNDSDKVVYTPIQTGDLYHDTLRIVNKGITPRDRYVTTALMKVRDGMKVKPVNN